MPLLDSCAEISIILKQMRFKFKECKTLQIFIKMVMDTTFYLITKCRYSASQPQKSKASLLLSNENKRILSVIFLFSTKSDFHFLCIFVIFFFPFSFQFYLFAFIENLWMYLPKYCNHPSVIIKYYATAMLSALCKASSNVRKLQLWDKLMQARSTSLSHERNVTQ